MLRLQLSREDTAGRQAGNTVHSRANATIRTECYPGHMLGNCLILTIQLNIRENIPHYTKEGMDIGTEVMFRKTYSFPSFPIISSMEFEWVQMVREPKIEFPFENPSVGSHPNRTAVAKHTFYFSLNLL